MHVISHLAIFSMPQESIQAFASLKGGGLVERGAFFQFLIEEDLSRKECSLERGLVRAFIVCSCA